MLKGVVMKPSLRAPASLRSRPSTFAAACAVALAVGLPAVGCAAAPLDDAPELAQADEVVGVTTASLSIVLSEAQRAYLTELCNDWTQSPELHYRSAEPAGFGTYDESSVWRKVHCQTDELSYTFVWERAFGAQAVRTTLVYNAVGETSVTLVSNCVDRMHAAWGATATTTASDYVCANADDALRTWMEQGAAPAVPPTFVKHGNNGTV
ncbi:hypothetical protein EON77_02910, partial [bacterium]